ncbi:MAG: DUF1844 domain-containing protein [Nanoarchaeota archaeon]|nr:DUF1844 domain-containing protein [Nanoarchaeota archaeon]
MNEDEKNSAHFMQLVFGLQSSAWMLLGKVMNPMTGKVEKNIEHAQATIDTLLMLKAKTKGNLSSEEENMLNSAISQLQLNYIEEAQKKDEPAVEEKKEEVKEEKEKQEEKAEEKKEEEKVEEKDKKTETKEDDAEKKAEKEPIKNSKKQ